MRSTEDGLLPVPGYDVSMIMQSLDEVVEISIGYSEATSVSLSISSQRSRDDQGRLLTWDKRRRACKCPSIICLGV